MKDKMRFALEGWMAWWDGPAKDFGLHELPIIPPITRTREALFCVICAGIEEDGECAACGRKMYGPAPGG